MKTPEEIKLGLRYLGARNVDDKLLLAKSLVYAWQEDLACDALAYIQQLEAQRDAAVKDVSLFPDCGTCKYNPRKKGYIPNDCYDCVNHCNWQWRGLPEQPKEDTHEQ